MHIQQLLDCKKDVTNRFKVKSRERTDLEFKESPDENALRKCLKTIAAFANANGGRIIFGVTDSPRYVCGISEFPDEADLQNLIGECLYPTPEIQVIEHLLDDDLLIELYVHSSVKRPVIATKDVQTKERKNKTVLSQGVVYARRAGQTKPITGEEFGRLLERRDEQIRSSILSLLSRANSIGFDQVAVADFRKYGSAEENVTLWVPEGAAKDLNIIDRARLVEDAGAPAYQIRGQVQLTTPSDKDPRVPLLPAKSVRALKGPVTMVFGTWFPWTERHLRKAAEHLGFWNEKTGDGRHTGWEQNTERPLYYVDGRNAILRFAKTSPEEFVEVIGSRETRARFKRENATKSKTLPGLQAHS